jgi:hypothetical protein
MRGKNKAGHLQENKIHQQHEAIREKNKLALVHDYKRAKVQTEAMTADLEFLDRVEGKFDAFNAAITGQTSQKR